jgi:hypothetical protein
VSGISGGTENESLKDWLRPNSSQTLRNWLRPAEQSSGDVSTPVKSKPLESVSELDASCMDSKCLTGRHEETELMRSGLAAAAKADAAADHTRLPEHSGLMITSAPNSRSSSASKLPKLQTRGNSAVGNDATSSSTLAGGPHTGGESPPKTPRSPESGRRREVVETAFAPIRTHPNSLGSSAGREMIQAAHSLSASSVRRSSSSLSQSRLPSGDQHVAVSCPLTGGVRAHSSRIDRSQHGHSLTRSNIPSSPTRGSAGDLQTETTRSETFHSCPLPRSQAHTTAILSSPEKSLPRIAFGSSLPQEVFAAASAAPTDSRDVRRCSSGTPKKRPAPSCRRSMSPRQPTAKSARKRPYSVGINGRPLNTVPAHGSKQKSSSANSSEDLQVQTPCTSRGVAMEFSGHHRHLNCRQAVGPSTFDTGVQLKLGAASSNNLTCVQRMRDCSFGSLLQTYINSNSSQPRK